MNNISAEMSVEETKSSDSLPTSEEYEVLVVKQKNEFKHVLIVGGWQIGGESSEGCY